MVHPYRTMRRAGLFSLLMPGVSLLAECGVLPAVLPPAETGQPVPSVTGKIKRGAMPPSMDARVIQPVGRMNIAGMRHRNGAASLDRFEDTCVRDALHERFQHRHAFRHQFPYAGADGQQASA